MIIPPADQSAQTLFEQALAASLQRRSEQAVALLHTLLAHYPNHAGAHHLLGAEYAQAGRIDQALSEFGAALQLDPTMQLARFQMGLLLLTCARLDDASEVWQGLDALGSDNVLNRFRHSMMLVAQGKQDQARLELAAAISANSTMPALNNDMQTVMEVIAASSGQAEAPSAESPDAKHFLVASYLQSPTLH